MALATPVVLIFYHRPTLLKRIFSVVAAVRPQRLFLVADGPNDDIDAERCRAARAVVAHVNWPCQVERLYADSNLGVRRRPASGIEWAFQHVAEAIILEDDCVPDPSFFPFCESVLERYRTDDRVMNIGGGNFQFGRRRTKHSYYFSAYCGTWGWATWRRAWRHFDIDMKQWPERRAAGILESVCHDRVEIEYWRTLFDDIHGGRMTSSWDYQWLFAMWSQSGLSITPEVNLVSNMGFGPDATHTTSRKRPEAGVRTASIGKLDHPDAVYRHVEADRYFFEAIVRGRRWYGLPTTLRSLRCLTRPRTSA
jgi:hypothetical protein